jgi:hypothetical protein
MLLINATIFVNWLIKENIMRGSIRLIVGFLVVFGAVGGIDNASDSELMLLAGVASAGMLLMLSGLKASKEVS